MSAPIPAVESLIRSTDAVLHALRPIDMAVSSAEAMNFGGQGCVHRHDSRLVMMPLSLFWMRKPPPVVLASVVRTTSLGLASGLGMMIRRGISLAQDLIACAMRGVSLWNVCCVCMRRAAWRRTVMAPKRQHSLCAGLPEARLITLLKYMQVLRAATKGIVREFCVSGHSKIGQWTLV